MNYIEITKETAKAGDKVKLQPWGYLAASQAEPIDAEILEFGVSLGEPTFRCKEIHSDGSESSHFWRYACNYRIVED